MAWRLKIYFSDGSSEVDDDEYDSYDDARDAYDSWLEGYGAGRETLELAGEDFCDADIDDYEIYEE